MLLCSEETFFGSSGSKFQWHGFAVVGFKVSRYRQGFDIPLMSCLFAYGLLTRSRSRLEADAQFIEKGAVTQVSCKGFQGSSSGFKQSFRS